MTTEGRKAFRIEKRVPRVFYDTVVVLETDDWVEFERYCLDHPRWQGVTPLYAAYGAHPTHVFVGGGDSRRCSNCACWDNGSFMTHAPCGHEFPAVPFSTHLTQLEAARSAAGGVS